VDIGKEQILKEFIGIESDNIQKQGLHNAISLGLELKFGIDGIELLRKVKKVESIDNLEIIIEAIKIANKIEEIEKLV
jgi:hypothetical protein